MIINAVSSLILALSYNSQNETLYEDIIYKEEISEEIINYSYNNGIISPCDNQYLLNDLNGNVFILEEGEQNGFIIIDPISLLHIESVVTQKSPFNFNLFDTYYYFGPGMYFYKENNKFIHCINSDYIIDNTSAGEFQNNFNVNLFSFRNQVSDENFHTYLKDNDITKDLNIKNKVKISNKIYIDNFEYIKYSKFPENNDDSCGFVAASLVLNYYDKTICNGIVANNFKDDKNELISTEEKNPNINLKDKLVEYNNNNPISWAYTVTKSVNQYCADYSVKGEAICHLFNYGVKSSINMDKPCIIFGNFPNVSSNSGRVNHAITVYGFDERWWGGYYITNYGWKGYEEVSLGIGFIGSTMTFVLDEDYYKKNYKIKHDVYKFEDSYCKIEKIDNINVDNEFDFITKKYRCGFIHNEYLTISSRKDNYDTAYIEFQFVNPIRSLNINLSYWSKDERFTSPSISTLNFEYKDLYSKEFNNKINLFGYDISTNRNKQTTLTFNFPYKTKCFRIYSHFERISCLNDRNKGRICIGDITIDTYRSL